MKIDKLLEQENPSQQTFRRKKQIDDIKQKIKLINNKNSQKYVEKEELKLP